MPEETCIQPQTIEELILEILSDEAQIVRCLRVFFCDTLQDISKRYYECPERKVKLAQDLITAAAQKEAALAAVLEAISKFEEEQNEFIMLVPGASLQVTSSSATISGVKFDAKTDPGVTGGKISAVIGGEEIGSVSGIDEVTTNYTINLGGAFNPDDVTLKNTGTVTVFIRNVIAGGG